MEFPCSNDYHFWMSAKFWGSTGHTTLKLSPTLMDPTEKILYFRKHRYSWIFRLRREHEKLIRHSPSGPFSTIHPSFWFVDKFEDFDGLTIQKKGSGEKIGTPTFLNIGIFLIVNDFFESESNVSCRKFAQNIHNVCLGMAK